MKKENLLKSIIVLGLTFMLILAISNFALADDELPWDEVVTVNGATNNTVNTTDNNGIVNNAGNNVGNSTVNGTGNSTINSAVNNSLNNAVNNKVNNVINNTTGNVSSNALAYTGSASTNGIIAVIVVIGLAVAVYSYRKINEYKNI